jgi:hypothetical protein
MSQTSGATRFYPMSKALNPTEIELLTDYIVEASNDPRVNLALLLLLDEIDCLSTTRPFDVECVCVFAKDRAYCRLMSNYKRQHKGDQPELIKQLRREFRWKGKL